MEFSEAVSSVRGGPAPPSCTPSDFSIEHILKRAGEAKGEEGNPATRQERPPPTRFEWLQCTRYHPPKLHRARRKESTPKWSSGGDEQATNGCHKQEKGRRKLGRNPRIPFSSSQVSALEDRFRHGHYLSSAEVASLASALGLSEARVKIWFQNRRARERKDTTAPRGRPLVTPASGRSLDTPPPSLGIWRNFPIPPTTAPLLMRGPPTTLHAALRRSQSAFSTPAPREVTLPLLCAARLHTAQDDEDLPAVTP